MVFNGFNQASNNIDASYMEVGDESMSDIHFWTTVKGYLSHLSYVFRKTKQMGTYFNNAVCYVTRALIFIEI